MKGIYLTEEGKKAIEDRIAELEGINIHLMKPSHTLGSLEGRISTLKEILSSATILPVEESWEDIGHDSGAFWSDDADVLESTYPNGVIIQPKQ
jgi:hypothetical protein